MTKLLDEDIRRSLARWADDAPAAADRLRDFDDLRAHRRTPRLPVLAAAAVLVAVTLVAVLLATPARDETGTIAGRPGIQARIPIGRFPGVRSVAADDGSIWVTSARDGVLTRIDPLTNETVASHEIGTGFEGIAAGGGLVWLTGFGELNRIVAVDADTGRILHEIPIDFEPWGVELAFGAAWVGGGGELHRVDPDTGVMTSYPIGRSAGFVVATASSLWVANPEDTSLTRVDPESGRVLDVARLGERPRSIAVDGEGDLWVTSPERDAVLHVDSASGDVIGRTVVGRTPMSLATDGDRLWVTTLGAGTVVQVDTATGDVIGRHPVGNWPASIVSTFGSVWVTLNQEAVLLRLDPRGALRTAASSWFEGQVPVAEDGDGQVFVRCSGPRGGTTIVLLQDVWHGTAAFPVLEAMLAESASVCIAERADVAGSQLAGSLRETLEGAGVSGPVIVMAHGAAGVVGRQVAASWPELAGLVLLDTNTESPISRDEQRESRFLASVHALFTSVGDLTITAPVLVATADPDAPPDPRSGDAATRRRFHANQQRLAQQLGGELVVIAGDPWPPAHRPETLAELLLDFARRSPYVRGADQICAAGRDQLRADPRLRDATTVLEEMERQLRDLGSPPPGLDDLGPDAAAALARITWAAESFNAAGRYELDDTVITRSAVQALGFRACGTQ